MEEDVGLPNSVAILEDDPEVAEHIAESMRSFRISEISIFLSAEEAWEVTEHKKFDLITLDWKLPNMSGLAYLNRIRSRSPNEFTPMLLISGFLLKEDLSLLEELPFTNRLEKPFKQLLLRSKIITLMREQNYYEQNSVKIRTLLKACNNDYEKVESELLNFIEDSPRPALFAIEAVRTLVRVKKFAQGERLCRAILAREPEHLMSLTEMGKILLHQKRYDESLEFLERARTLSPDNTERLCMMSMAHLEKLELALAEDFLQTAGQIDSDDEDVKAGKLLTKNILEFTGQDSVTSIPNNFASLLNAIGISLVKSQRIDEGIEHYKSALKYCSEDFTKAKLAFNCGLGFLRWGKREPALLWFKESVNLSEGQFERAATYVQKIETEGIDSVGAEDGDLALVEHKLMQ